ncbi:MAG: beta-ketoacyl-ACP synthase II [Dehalococcoidia bacterium]|jgi:3-oxoacyl-[acyl-carrier-protein] synthase II|nr:beta-ketoacyl-ACP synthase II [Dehalococcoidia bacterium]
MARAVITGLGCITPIGLDVKEFWKNLVNGVSGVGPISSFDASGLGCQIAAEVKGFDPLKYLDVRAARRMARFSQFAVAAAAQAVEDAELDISRLDPYRVGVVMNTGGGGVPDIAEGERTFLEKGPGRVSAFLVPMLAPNMPSCQIAMRYGIRGPVITSVAACAAGAYAFVEAKWIIDRGEADVVIVGGTEASLHPLTIAAFDNMRALSRRNHDPQGACRPFDKDRDGFVFGEGAVAMVVEKLEHALKRGAPIYAELSGGALSCDAYHVTAPEPSGEAAAQAMIRALRNANIGPEEVNYIVAHGTGTPLNDVTETLAIKRALGEHAYRVAISSPKSMVGHLLGAAGALSALTAVLAISHGIVPPTINLDNQDPECDLDYVPKVARHMSVTVAMVNAFGFGGQNASLVFRRYE